MAAGKVRVAVVGTGRWAQVAHIPGWLRDPRAEVVAIADVDAAALRRGGQRIRRRRAPLPTTANCSTTRTST